MPSTRASWMRCFDNASEPSEGLLSYWRAEVSTTSTSLKMAIVQPLHLSHSTPCCLHRNQLGLCLRAEQNQRHSIFTALRCITFVFCVRITEQWCCNIDHNLCALIFQFSIVQSVAIKSSSISQRFANRSAIFTGNFYNMKIFDGSKYLYSSNTSYVGKRFVMFICYFSIARHKAAL